MAVRLLIFALRHRRQLWIAVALLLCASILAAVFAGRYTNDLSYMFPEASTSGNMYHVMQSSRLTQSIQLELDTGIYHGALPLQAKLEELAEWNPETGTGKLEIQCSKGTYIRTLLHDMGQTLGCGAIMTGLRRTCASGFGLNDCYTLEEIQKLADENKISEIFIPVENAFQVLPKILLNESQTTHYRHGVKLGLSQLRNQMQENQERYAVYGTPDGFLGTALADAENDLLKIERNLCEPRGAKS